MTPDPTLLGTVLDLLSEVGVLRTRKMFGGVYIYCNDLFIATVHDETLYFKANAATAPGFLERGLRIFSYPKEGGTATLQYYQAPPEVFEGRAAMKVWAKKALLAAQQDAAAKGRKAPQKPKPSVVAGKRTPRRRSDA
jgi:DNA transformation protein and related proteins